MIRLRSHQTRLEGKRNRSTPHWLQCVRQTKSVWWVANATEASSTPATWSPVEAACYPLGARPNCQTVGARLSGLFPLLLLLFAGFFLSAGMLPAAQIVLYNPTEGSSNIVLDMEATNNNDGAIYNSADLNVTSQLATDLWALDANSNNSDPSWNGYNTIDDMIADWDMNIRAPSTGEVYDKWDATANADGSFSIDTSGLGPDTWFATQQDASQDMQFYTINIPKSQLELDGISGYNPASDATIVLSGAGNTINDAFTAYAGVDTFQTSGQYFQVAVPEFSSSALAMGGLAGLLAGLRRRRLQFAR